MILNNKITVAYNKEKSIANSQETFFEKKKTNLAKKKGKQCGSFYYSNSMCYFSNIG